MGKSASKKFKYQSILEQFLAGREWHDELDVDAEEKTFSLVTGINLEGQNAKLIVQAGEDVEMVDVVIIYGFACKQNKLQEMAILLNAIHLRCMYGRFLVDVEDGEIRWHHRVDFQGSEPTGQSVEQIVGPGWNFAEIFASTIAAVALTKQTAADAIAEFDESQKNGEEGSDDGEVTEL